MHLLIGLFLIVAALFLAIPHPSVLGESTSSAQILTPQENLQPIKTESRFTEKLEESSQVLLKKTVYQDDPETEAGIDRVLEEGTDGKRTTVTKFTYYEGNLYSQEVVATEITPPQDKTILRGTKIIWRTINTSDGEIRYWKKIRVWATQYDHNCPGCDWYTATGRRATKGIVAVDPKVISLGTKVYVPGYGLAEAQDTGGAIKGNIIDVCFDDTKTSGWYSHFVDIYLL